jgi:hypothetical protein
MDHWSESLTGNTLPIIWYEYVSASWGWTEKDIEWKTLLQERLAANGDARKDTKDLCTDLRHLREYTNSDDKGREALLRMS